MRFPLLIVLIWIVINALVDFYTYCALHSYFKKKLWRQLQGWSALFLPVLPVATLILNTYASGTAVATAITWLLYIYVCIYVPKYLFFIFDVLSRIPMLWRGNRWKWMSSVGLWLGILIIGLILWGTLINRYQINVNEVSVEVKGLPREFNGFTIAQISDLHLGTFGEDDSFVRKLVDHINELKPDMIVFTGDIVNRSTAEINPFTGALSRLHAPYGVYSILGNHDYGDYMHWNSDTEKQQSLQQLKDTERNMGWKMLNNDHDWIRRGNDSIALIGVENIGEPPFTVYGDLHKAYSTIGDNKVKILLSHNPKHWCSDIKDNPKSNIALTLSGHTHAMQVCLFGISPSALRYDTWGGKYTDSRNQTLYVNIGAGTIGFPGRIGATPEITLITLRPTK